MTVSCVSCRSIVSCGVNSGTASSHSVELCRRPPLPLLYPSALGPFQIMHVRQVLQLHWEHCDQAGIEQMCTFIDSISFCSFLFSIACARAVLTLSLWSKVWSENVWARRALKCGVMWDVYYARALSQQSNRTTFHMMHVLQTLRLSWKHTDHAGIEHMCTRQHAHERM